MKKRTKGFLSKENIDHNSEPFQYIQELHSYLWKFIRSQIPGASGKINEFIDSALEKAMKEDNSEYPKLMYVGDTEQELNSKTEKRYIFFESVNGYFGSCNKLEDATMCVKWKFAQDIEEENPEIEEDYIKKELERLYQNKVSEGTIINLDQSIGYKLGSEDAFSLIKLKK